MKTTVKDTINYISQTGGIKVESNKDMWVNPAHDMAKNMVLRQKEELTGKEVNMVIEDGKYLSVAVLSEIQGEPLVVIKEDFESAVNIECKPVEQYDKIASLKDYDYQKIRTITCKIDKKGKFNYISWSHAWDTLKQLYPDSTYEVKENVEGNPLFKFGTGGAVKVSVIVKGLEHSIWMPILDYSNKSVKFDLIDSFMVNTAIQRGLAKSIALHGLGIFVFHGEDIAYNE